MTKFMGLTAAIRTLRNYILYLLPFLFLLMRIASFEFLSGDFGVSGVISRLLVLCIVYMKDCPHLPRTLDWPLPVGWLVGYLVAVIRRSSKRYIPRERCGGRWMGLVRHSQVSGQLDSRMNQRQIRISNTVASQPETSHFEQVKPLDISPGGELIYSLAV